MTSRRSGVVLVASNTWKRPKRFRFSLQTLDTSDANMESCVWVCVIFWIQVKYFLSFLLFFPSTPQNNFLLRGQINQQGRGTFMLSFLTASGIVSTHLCRCCPVWAPGTQLRSPQLLLALLADTDTLIACAWKQHINASYQHAALTQSRYTARPRRTENWACGGSSRCGTHHHLAQLSGEVLAHILQGGDGTGPETHQHRSARFTRPFTVAAELPAARTCGSSWPPCCRVGRTRSCCRFLQRLVCTGPR